jgi:hypothetical protein
LGQQERREVVDLEGLLEAVDGLGAVAEDPARVVAEDVDPRAGRVQAGGELTDLGEDGEVGDEVVDPQLLRDRGGLLRRAADDDDAAKSTPTA